MLVTTRWFGRQGRASACAARVFLRARLAAPLEDLGSIVVSVGGWCAARLVLWLPSSRTLRHKNRRKNDSKSAFFELSSRTRQRRAAHNTTRDEEARYR